MKKSLTFLSMLLLGLASLSTHAQTALRGGFVENADVFAYMDIQQLNQSAFSKAVDAMQSEEDKAMAEEKAAALTEATGLTEDDVLFMAFSMDIDNLDFENMDPSDLGEVQGVLAVELAKAVTLEQVIAGIEAISEEEIEAELSIEEVDGLKVIKLSSTDTAEGPDEAFGTLSPDGKTLLMSFNTLSLKDGLARIVEDKTAAPTADMAAAMQAMGKRQARFVLVLPAEARQTIEEGVGAAAAQGGPGAMMAPFATAKSLLISANTAENLDFYLSLDLGNPGNATQATGMAQGMLPMLMMSMGPQAMEMAQKIKISSQDSVITMSMSLSPEDVQKMNPANQMGGNEMIME